MLIKLRRVLAVSNNKLRMRPHESLRQEITFPSKFSLIKTAMPPCFSRAGDQNLGPDQQEEKPLMDSSRENKVS